MDEATDSDGRHVAAVVMRSLEDGTSRPYLIDAVSATIKLTVDDCIRSLGDKCNRNDVLMLVTDAAPYMRKAGKKLILFSNHFH